eukprot:scpid43810/ scgid16737/ 
MSTMHVALMQELRIRPYLKESTNVLLGFWSWCRGEPSSKQARSSPRWKLSTTQPSTKLCTNNTGNDRGSPGYQPRQPVDQPNTNAGSSLTSCTALATTYRSDIKIGAGGEFYNSG